MIILHPRKVIQLMLHWKEPDTAVTILPWRENKNTLRLFWVLTKTSANFYSPNNQSFFGFLSQTKNLQSVSKPRHPPGPRKPPSTWCPHTACLLEGPTQVTTTSFGGKKYAAILVCKKYTVQIPRIKDRMWWQQMCSGLSLDSWPLPLAHLRSVELYKMTFLDQR